jgi:spore germination protein
MEATLQDPSRRARVAERVAALVTRHGFDGINLDFEGPFGAYRDQYSDFVRQVAARLHQAGKGVTVDVATQLVPVDRLPLSSWSAPFDYAALAAASDAVILMAYAHSIRRPGSLAPLWWVTDAVHDARARIPAGKLIVGTAFYGRHWVIAGQTVTHTDLTQGEAEALLSASGAVLQRPVADATPRFTWQDGSGTHIVHYEDGQSLATKLHLARASGVACWRLGLEQPAQWEVIAAAR